VGNPQAVHYLDHMTDVLVGQWTFLRAWVRLITRPAPRQLEPKVRSGAFWVPTSTYEAVPIEPGHQRRLTHVLIVGR
jgi:hypothetical protein